MRKWNGYHDKIYQRYMAKVDESNGVIEKLTGWITPSICDRPKQSPESTPLLKYSNEVGSSKDDYLPKKKTTHPLPKNPGLVVFLAIVNKHPLFLPLYFTCNYYKIPWCYQVPMYLCTSILITKVKTPLDNMFEDAIVRKKKRYLLLGIHLASIGVWFYLSKSKKE